MMVAQDHPEIPHRPIPLTWDPTIGSVNIKALPTEDNSSTIKGEGYAADLKWIRKKPLAIMMLCQPSHFQSPHKFQRL